MESRLEKIEKKLDAIRKEVIFEVEKYFGTKTISRLNSAK